MPTESRGRTPPWLAAAAKRRPLLGLVVILLVLAVAYLVSGTAGATGPTGPGSTASTTQAAAEGPSLSVPAGQVAESALPTQARDTLKLIRTGGPFPYSQDGAVFGNRERLLPQQAAGYYREYTVRTPGEGDRGPRRIVVGADGSKYYSDDHYASFRRIAEGR